MSADQGAQHGAPRGAHTGLAPSGDPHDVGQSDGEQYYMELGGPSEHPPEAAEPVYERLLRYLREVDPANKRVLLEAAAVDFLCMLLNAAIPPTDDTVVEMMRYMVFVAGKVSECAFAAMVLALLPWCPHCRNSSPSHEHSPPPV